MTRGKLILICQSGGEFVSNNDGSLQYTGGEAHALDVTHGTRFEDLKLELAEMWNYDVRTISIKYFLPSNRRTLITVSNDKDLKRMIDFHGDSVTADVYIVARESVSHDVLNMHGSRGSRTIVAESVNHIAASTPAATTPAVATSAILIGDAAPVATSPPVVAPVVIDSTIATPVDSTAASAADVDVAPAADVDAAPIVTDAPITAPVLVDTTNATSADTTAAPAITTATSTPTVLAIAPGGTTDRTSVVSADATNPSITRVAAASTLSPPNGATADNVRQQKRTASWKFGINGLSIVSVADDVERQRCTASLENDIKIPTTANAAGEEQRYTESWKNDISSPSTDDVGLTKLITSWKNGITGVGQQFSSVHEFRDALRKYSIAHHFVYELKKNDTNRATAICRAKGCLWRVHASWVPGARSFRIKKMNKSHTCGGNTGKSSHPTKNWLANVIKDRLRDSPHYKPKEIASEICRDFGIDLNYSQVWRGMETARVQLQGSYKEAYNQLPQFCEKVVETNPGSVATFSTKEDLSFQRVFISFHASLYGFQNGCRSLLFLDSTSLKSKYQEILLAAAAVDANDGMFPVAFAIVDVENDDNWYWFLEQLKFIVSTSRPVTFVSDKEKGLRKSVHEVFGNAYHGYCIRRLVENFKKNLKGPYHGDGKYSLAGNLLAAAHSPRLDGFTRCTQRIKSVSSEAYNWVMHSEPEYWANALFKGERYNQITLDIVEVLNNWITEARELPIIQKIDVIRCKMMEMIYTRRVDSSSWCTKLTPSKEERLREETSKAQTLKVLISSDSIFEVHDDSINVVNTDQWDCSCQGWKITGLPCCHAIAVFNCTGRSLYDYCSTYFTTESFRLTYSESINPMPDIGKPVNTESSDTSQVHPPRTHRPTSRLKRKQTKSQEIVKRPLHCSKCKGAGHNRATCKET